MQAEASPSSPARVAASDARSRSSSRAAASRSWRRCAIRAERRARSRAPPRARASRCASRTLDVTRPETLELPDGLRVLVNNAGLEGSAAPGRARAARAVARALRDQPVRPARGHAAARSRSCAPPAAASSATWAPRRCWCRCPSSPPTARARRRSRRSGESLRAELAPFGIRLLEILPGRDRHRHAAPLRPRCPKRRASRTTVRMAERVDRARRSAAGAATPVGSAPRSRSPTPSSTTRRRCASRPIRWARACSPPGASRTTRR